jgi:spartin
MLTFVDPVAIELPQDGAGNVSVTNAMPEFLRTASHPAYAKSSLVQSSATASRLMMTTSAAIGNALQSGADSFTKKTKPAPTPMTFKPTTHEHVRKINSFTHSAAGISAKTVNQITKYAQNIGASISGTDKKERDPNKKPGILNKSLIAISTIGDGIEESARMLLHSGSVAASTVVGHRYGAEAGQVAHSLTGGVKNVGLVYIDATGVSRRAVIKSVAKGMVVGRMKDGQALVVGDGEQPGHGHGQPPHRSLSAGPQTAGIGPAPSSPYNPAGALSVGPPHIQRRPSPAPTPPPPYASNNGSSLGGTPMRGEKR